MTSPVDLLVVGGGVQGAAIARDAAGRGLTVRLVERGDLAGETSGASSKLIHGGLRYLEHGEFALVREALREREVLMGAAPHLVRPLRFVLPRGGRARGLGLVGLDRGGLLGRPGPGGRPAWMLRLGLFLYDHLGGGRGGGLGGGRTLPRSASVTLSERPLGVGLRPEWTRGFAYSDAVTDDARLVVLLARDAADQGAVISTRTELRAARRVGELWEADLVATDGGATETITARALVNAAGPWAGRLLGAAIPVSAGAPRPRLRLVQGVHVVVPRLHDGDHALILPQPDGRVVFVIPFEGRWSLVGTTEVPLGDDPAAAGVTGAELEYLMGATAGYLDRRWSPDDVAWSTCGIRPLADDGAGDASSNSREDVLKLDSPPGGAPLLTVVGGKLTTHRRVAERALARLVPLLPPCAPAWTDRGRLPGAAGLDAGLASVQNLTASLCADYPKVAGETILGLVRRHGTGARRILKAAVTSASATGRRDGGIVYLAPGLLAAEVDHFVEREWALTVDDVIWRRCKAGLVADERSVAAIGRRLAAARGALHDGAVRDGALRA